MSKENSDIKTHRQRLLHKFLSNNGFEGKLSPIQGDASWRQYYRWSASNERNYAGNTRQIKQAIVMDAPPEKESIAQFIQARQFFQSTQTLLFPEIYAVDEPLGFAVVEDFGATHLIQCLQQNEQKWMLKAIVGLSEMQTTAPSPDLPIYNHDLLMTEMQMFIDWFLDRHLKLCLNTDELKVLQQTMAQIATQITQQPQTLVHRDYHSNNLLQCGEHIGVIDFQDAVLGSYTYDVVSLLCDAYYHCDKPAFYRQYFYQKIQKNDTQQTESLFETDFAYQNAQRQLKVAGIFARLYYREGKSSYMAYLPTVLNHLSEAIHRLPIPSEFKKWVEQAQKAL